MSYERSLEVINGLIETIENGGVLYSKKELKELTEAIEVAIEAIKKVMKEGE